MNTHEFDARESSVKDHHNDTSSSGGLEALQRMHNDVTAARSANTTVRFEMTKVDIMCSPPPITPPCQAVDLPPDPVVVTGAIANLNKADRQVQEELTNLKAEAAGAGKNYSKDFQTLSQQAQTFSAEITGLNGLASFHRPENHNYDKEEILSETVKIAKIAKQMDKTLKQLEVDLGK